jgi:hypothetical protein
MGGILRGGFGLPSRKWRQGHLAALQKKIV